LFYIDFHDANNLEILCYSCSLNAKTLCFYISYIYFQ